MYKRQGQCAADALSMPLSPESQVTDAVSGIMAIVHSRNKTLSTHVPDMCQLVIRLSAAGSDLAACYPPRVLTQAKYSARKWILDILCSSAPDLKLVGPHAVPLWALLEAISSECSEVRGLAIQHRRTWQSHSPVVHGSQPSLCVTGGSASSFSEDGCGRCQESSCCCARP